MFENDWLSRQIEIISRALSVLLLGKDTAANLIREEENNESLVIEDETLLAYMLEKHLRAGEINKAENLLYESISDNPSMKKLEIALSFYDTLNRMDDEALRQCDFSRQEVLKGLADIQGFYCLL